MGILISVMILKGIAEEIRERFQEMIAELLPGFAGTIYEFEDFDAEADCNVLNDAIDRVKMDTDAVIEVLCNRSNEQRCVIREQYKGLYGEDLYDVCKRIRRDDLRHVVKGMLLSPVDYDAKCIRGAVRGIGSSDDDVLIEILCARPNAYIEDLKEIYEEKYGKSLEDEITDNVRGEFERFLVAVIQCQRDEGPDTIDPDAAEEDAQELFDAGEDRWLFTDESVFTRIMARRSWMQIRLIAEKYEEISGGSLMSAINSECHGETRRAYKATVRMATDPCYYFARNIYKSMKGLGTDDDALVRNIVFTSEWGLQTIKERYEEDFGSSIADDIDSDCRGDYQDILLAIVK